MRGARHQQTIGWPTFWRAGRRRLRPWRWPTKTARIIWAVLTQGREFQKVAKFAPWDIVRSDNKRRARLNCISHILKTSRESSPRRNRNFVFVIQIEIALAIVMIADIDGELAMLVIVVAPDTD
jgi:hypothetical protein